MKFKLKIETLRAALLELNKLHGYFDGLVPLDAVVLDGGGSVYRGGAVMSYEVFKELLEQCNEETSKLLLGETVTVGVPGGSYMAAKLQFEVEEVGPCSILTT